MACRQWSSRFAPGICSKKRKYLGTIIGVTIGAVIMVVGYSLGRAFIYSTPEYAIAKLPYQILQAAVGAVVGAVLCCVYNLKDRMKDYLDGRKRPSKKTAKKDAGEESK